MKLHYAARMSQYRSRSRLNELTPRAGLNLRYDGSLNTALAVD